MNRTIAQQGKTAIEGVLTVACPTAACLLTVLVICGPRAVSPASPAFQVIVDGSIVGVLTLAAGRWRVAGLCMAATLLTVSMLAFASEASTRIAAHTIIVMVALTGITFASTRLLTRGSRSGFLSTLLTWAGVSMCLYFLTGVILLILFQAADFSAYVRLYVRLSLALGLGLGLGFAIRDRFGPRIVGTVMRIESGQGHGGRRG